MRKYESFQVKLFIYVFSTIIYIFYEIYTKISYELVIKVIKNQIWTLISFDLLLLLLNKIENHKYE